MMIKEMTMKIRPIRGGSIGIAAAIAVFAIAAFVAVTLNGAEGVEANGVRYKVQQQGILNQRVLPIAGSESIQDFYDYGTLPASSNTGLEMSDVSILFLYDDGAGEISLVMIHDIPNDGSGGKAVFDFSGVPVGTSFVVGDDGGEASLPTSTWRWDQCCTDGGALSGTLNGDFAIIIDADFPESGGISPGKIDEWVFLSPDNHGVMNVIPLDASGPVRISAMVHNDN